jgi:hypothetical protein
MTDTIKSQTNCPTCGSKVTIGGSGNNNGLTHYYIPVQASVVFNGFWKRLELFMENVNVNDIMSEEEKEMILSVCKRNIK